MKHGPWTSGPQELIDHAKDHLAKGSDVDHRFAMISVDNAVELMLKTYLTLPERVTGLRLTRNEQEAHTRSFLTALAAIEQLVGDRLTGVPLGEIEWFHRVRNQIYHEGNAITVERDKVTRYLEHAELLMRSLFGRKPPEASGPRRRLTDHKFFALLGKTVTDEDVALVRRLKSDAVSLGLEIQWRAASFTLRLADPGGTRQRFSLLLLSTDGGLAGGWLASQLQKVGLPRRIAEQYFDRVAALFDHCSVKKQASGDLNWTRQISLSEFGGRYDQFMDILADTIDEIKQASQARG